MRPRPLGTLGTNNTTFPILAQQLGGLDEIAGSKLVRVGGDRRFVQPSPHHLGVVVVQFGGCHLNGRMNALIVPVHHLGLGVQLLGRVVSRHSLVREFFERAIETFGHQCFGLPAVE